MRLSFNCAQHAPLRLTAFSEQSVAQMPGSHTLPTISVSVNGVSAGAKVRANRLIAMMRNPNWALHGAFKNAFTTLAIVMASSLGMPQPRIGKNRKNVCG